MTHRRPEPAAGADSDQGGAHPRRRRRQHQLQYPRIKKVSTSFCDWLYPLLGLGSLLPFHTNGIFIITRATEGCSPALHALHARARATSAVPAALRPSIQHYFLEHEPHTIRISHSSLASSRGTTLLLRICPFGRVFFFWFSGHDARLNHARERH